MVDLTLYSVLPATIEQEIAHAERSHEEFGARRGLSVREWVDFSQKKLKEIEMSKKGKITFWCAPYRNNSVRKDSSFFRVLAPRDNPTGLDFVCSCRSSVVHLSSTKI